MINIACQSITWGPDRNRNDTVGVIAEVAKAGFNGIEIGARHLDPEKIPLYRDTLQMHNIRLLALHVGGDFLDRGSVEKQIAGIGTAISMAASLGARFLFVSGTHKPGKNEADYVFEADTYTKIGAACHDAGLMLCYHNHDWEIVNNMHGLDILLSRCPSDLVGLVPDVGWITRAGADPVALLTKLGDRVKVVHFKEFTADNKFTELGTGIVNFKAVYDLVKDRPDYWIVAEQDTTVKIPLESATINCAFIKALA